MRISDWSSDVCSSDLVLFIAYFLPWFKVDFGLGSVSASGGDIGFLWSTLPMLIGLVMAGVIIASKLFGVKLPELPMPWSQVHLALGALAAILVVLKLIIGEDPTDIVDRAYGLFLAALAAIGLAAGGFLMFKAGDDAPTTGGSTGSAPF